MAILRTWPLTLLLGFALSPPRAHAQQPGPLTTLVGVVVEEGTGAPVSGALLSLGVRGPRAIADTLGAFRMVGVAQGAQTLLIQRFGYRDLEVSVTVSDPSTPLRLVMRPDPVVLEGLSVTGGASVPLTGVVRDARTDAPVPWTSLVLSRDVVRPVGRATSDPQGVFRIGEVPTGDYFLRIQAIGYQSQYTMVTVNAPPDPLELRLQPDSLVQAGVARFNRLLKGRRNYASGITYDYGQDRLHYTSAPSVTRFLELETSLFLVRCTGPTIGDLCIVGRGGAVIEPKVYIDELPIMAGLEVLESYSPSELYLIEVFGGGSTIRAYTYPFMERMALRPRPLFPG